MVKKIEKSLIILGLFAVSVFLFFLTIRSFFVGVFLTLLFFVFSILIFRRKFSLKNLLVGLLFLAIIAPPIRTGTTPYIRPELVLIIIAWILYIFDATAKGKDIKIKWSSIYKWFFLFGGLIFFSIFFSAVALDFNPAFRDFFELAKLLEYFLFFAFAFTLDFKDEDFKRYYFFLISIFSLAAIIGIIQYFNLLPSFNSLFIRYVAPAHLDEWIRHKRIVGTTGGPNDFGILMALASLFSLVGFLWIKVVKKKVFSLCFLFIFGFVLILTLSRSAIAAFLVGVVFILFYKYPKKLGIQGKMRFIFLILPIIFILTIVIFSISPPKLFVRINSLLGVESDVSLQKRLVTWQENLDIWRQSPVFGWGPGKDEMSTIVDNEWLLLLRRYGMVGLIVFIFLFLKIYFGVGMVQKKENIGEFEIIFSVFCQAAILSIAIYMIPAAFYHSLQLMPILMAFLGLSYIDKNFLKKNL